MAAGAGRGDGVLGKLMSILHAFGVDDHGLGFAQLQGRTGLAKGTLHRLLSELENARLLDRADGRYHLGRHLFELGMRASVERGLVEVAMPFMEDLYEHTHEIVHLGLREGLDVVYLAKVGGHRQAKSPSRLGGRMPLHATAIGKVLLAHAPHDVQREVLTGDLERLAPRTITARGTLRKQLDEIVEGGLAYEFEESAVGLTCAAAPVLDPSGQVCAAISVTGPLTRFRAERHARTLQAAAAGIAATLVRRKELLDRTR